MKSCFFRSPFFTFSFLFFLISYCKLWPINNEPSAQLIFIPIWKLPTVCPKVIEYYISYSRDFQPILFSRDILLQDLDSKKEICPSLAGMARERFSLDLCEPRRYVGITCTLAFSESLQRDADHAPCRRLIPISFANGIQEWGRIAAREERNTPYEYSCQ